MELKFKTDGIRGIVQKEITPDLFYKIGCFLGANSNLVVVGKDTRRSGDLYCRALINGIISCGADVFELGVCVTPSLSFLTKHYSANYGVMITASHNPTEYNGIKVFDTNGDKIDNSIKEKINKLINDNSFIPMYKEDIGRIYDKSSSLIDIYLKSMFEEFDLDNLFDCSFLIDGSNGGGYKLLPALLNGFSINDFIKIGCSPDGENINLNVGSLHIHEKMQLLKKYACNFGFALDGDGDRLIGITPNTVLDGDVLSYIIIKNNLEQYKTGCVITPLTNRRIKKYLEELNINVYQSDVGDQNVYLKMKETGALIGFEKSGHILFNDHPCDGLYSLCNFLLTYRNHKNEVKKDLQNLKVNPSKLINIKSGDLEKVKHLLSNSNLKEEVYKRLKDDGYLFIRESGTEKLLRIYLESEDKNDLDRAESYLLEKVKGYVWNSWSSK